MVDLNQIEQRMKELSVEMAAYQKELSKIAEQNYDVSTKFLEKKLEQSKKELVAGLETLMNN